MAPNSPGYADEGNSFSLALIVSLTFKRGYRIVDPEAVASSTPRNYTQPKVVPHRTLSELGLFSAQVTAYTA